MRPADVAARNGQTRLLHERVAAIAERHGVHDAGLRRQVDQLLRLGRRHRQRLVGDDVLALGDGGRVHGIVQVVRRRVVDDVDVRVVEQGLVAAVRLRHVQRVGLLARERLVHVGDGDDVHVAQPPHGVDMVRADEPDADDAHSESLHVLCLRAVFGQEMISQGATKPRRREPRRPRSRASEALRRKRGASERVGDPGAKPPDQDRARAKRSAPTRSERGDEAPSESACRGVCGGEAPRIKYRSRASKAKRAHALGARRRSAERERVSGGLRGRSPPDQDRSRASKAKRAHALGARRRSAERERVSGGLRGRSPPDQTIAREQSEARPRARSEATKRRARARVGGSAGAKPPGSRRIAREQSEARPRARSEATKRRARARVGGSAGAKPPG